MTKEYPKTCRVCGAELIRKREPIGAAYFYGPTTVHHNPPPPTKYAIILICPNWTWHNGDHTDLLIERPEGTPFPYPSATEHLPFAESEERSRLWSSICQEYEEELHSRKAPPEPKADAQPQSLQ